MKNIKIGVVGIGNIGSVHVKSIAEGEIDGMMLSAICDIDAEKVSKMEKQYPACKGFTDYKALVDSGVVDALIVAVPHALHGEIGEYALKKGLHVLVEKPVDISVSVGKRLNETAEKSGKVFGIMFNQRTNHLFQKTREIVKSGQLGQLKRSVWIITNWYRTQKYYDSGDWRATWSGEGGGVLLNQAPHNLDLWQWILGMPKAVTAYCQIGKHHDIEVEDDVIIFTEYESGATGTFITSTGEYPGTNRLEISGDLGKLVLENGTLKWWKLKQSDREVCKQSEELFPSIEMEYTEFTDDTSKKGHIAILQNFADAILNGTPLLSPGVEGIHELTISNAAYLSQWSGNQKITLPFDSEKFDLLLAEKQKNSKQTRHHADHVTHNGYSERWQVRW